MREGEAILLQKADDLARLTAGSLSFGAPTLLSEHESPRFQREYSKSKEATSVLSSVGMGSLCLRRLAM